ncbi:MAG: dihydroorotate dehydrogenase catalytic subunit, partial [Myxococcales bacterium]|nr:dihydroorotate dehydrogenase catalytic subunit [Myxococcales bacterium]
SGPAIKPIALRMVHQVAKALPDLPISGIGGVYTGEDALEFLMAGARCVQVGTACFAEPGAIVRITDELRALLGELGFASVAAAVGCLEPIEPEPPYASTRDRGAAR